MYENELALTGVGAIVLGPIVVQTWLPAALIVIIGVALIAASRIARRLRR